MGHAIHFLQRLERLSARESALALRLYRQPALVAECLAFWQPPGDAERFALPLAEGTKGPYLVVAQDGHVVTCLAKGMGIGGLPTLSFGQLNAYLERASQQRSHRSIAQELVGDGEIEDLLSRILVAGQGLSREEMLGLSTLQPMLALTFVRALFQDFDDMEQCQEQWAPKLVKRLPEDLLLRYMQRHWGLGHLLVLCAWNGASPLGPFLQLLDEWTPPPSLAWPVFRQGDLVLGVRAVWAIGKLGRVWLPFYKKQLIESSSALGWLEAIVMLLVLSLRHKKCRAEVHKLLTQRLDMPDVAAIHWGELRDAVHHLCLRLINEPETLKAEQSAHAKQIFWKVLSERDVPPLYAYDTPEEVPISLAQAFLANLSIDYLNDGNGLLLLFQMIPWLASIDAEALYLPKGLLDVLDITWSTSDAKVLIERRRQFYEIFQQPKVSHKVGRNEPCPCGSGKKYKKCCARTG